MAGRSYRRLGWERFWRPKSSALPRGSRGCVRDFVGFHTNPAEKTHTKIIVSSGCFDNLRVFVGLSDKKRTRRSLTGAACVGPACIQISTSGTMREPRGVPSSFSVRWLG